MTTLEELKNKKKLYVEGKANEILNEMIRREVTTDTLSTCDYSNWDRELHRNMPEIAEELRSKGLQVTSSVKFGVTDWTFKVLL
jgi:hypothetical protein